MLIRSQEKTKITDSVKFSICKQKDGAYGIYTPISCECFGKYSTEAKAIKVLDMIGEAYGAMEVSRVITVETIENSVRLCAAAGMNTDEATNIVIDGFANMFIFQMPADDEVRDD